jgi:hypothetical protein
MSILDGIKDKAQQLMGKASGLVSRKTDVYDASRNSIVVSGVTLDGVVTASVSDKQVTQQLSGNDDTYYTYYDVVTPQILTVNILPTARANEVLEILYERQNRLKGWLNISITENGILQDLFRGHIIALPEKQMQQEANDRTYTFGITTVTTPVAIDQNTPQNNFNLDEAISEEQNLLDSLPVDETQTI